MLNVQRGDLVVVLILWSPERGLDVQLMDPSEVDESDIDRCQLVIINDELGMS